MPTASPPTDPALNDPGTRATLVRYRRRGLTILAATAVLLAAIVLSALLVPVVVETIEPVAITALVFVAPLGAIWGIWTLLDARRIRGVLAEQPWVVRTGRLAVVPGFPFTGRRQWVLVALGPDEHGPRTLCSVADRWDHLVLPPTRSVLVAAEPNARFLVLATLDRRELSGARPVGYGPIGTVLRERFAQTDR